MLLRGFLLFRWCRAPERALLLFGINLNSWRLVCCTCTWQDTAHWFSNWSEEVTSPPPCSSSALELTGAVFKVNIKSSLSQLHTHTHSVQPLHLNTVKVQTHLFVMTIRKVLTCTTLLLKVKVKVINYRIAQVELWPPLMPHILEKQENWGEKCWERQQLKIKNVFKNPQ